MSNHDNLHLCYNCGKLVDMTMWVRLFGNCDAKWCVNCIRKKYGCNCGKCEYCKKKREWKTFQKEWMNTNE